MTICPLVVMVLPPLDRVADRTLRPAGTMFVTEIPLSAAACHCIGYGDLEVDFAAEAENKGTPINPNTWQRAALSALWAMSFSNRPRHHLRRLEEALRKISAK